MCVSAKDPDCELMGGKISKLTEMMQMRQNERNICYDRLAHTSIFGFYVSLLIKSCYSFIYSSLQMMHDFVLHYYSKSSCMTLEIGGSWTSKKRMFMYILDQL